MSASPIRPARIASIVSGAALLTLALAGCVPNNPTSGTALTVDITDTTCVVSANTAQAGTVKFTAKNTGKQVNEFEILAADKLRIVGEKENITPGQSIDFVTHLEPGTYYTECKTGMVGEGVGTTKFTVTGTSAKIDASKQQQIDTAVTNYIGYIKDRTAALVPAVKEFTDAYRGGDDAKARELYALARVNYERIEPTAEAFGDLDPKIDVREGDASEDGVPFIGFHRIEKDLWAPAGFTPSDAAGRAVLADGLVQDIQKLYDLVHEKDFTVSLDDISNGAIGLLDEVATSKITGEEDEFSHTDLYDFQANVEGAAVAYGNVRDIAKAADAEGAKLVESIDAKLTSLNTLLATYGSIDAGFVAYNTLTTDQVKELSDEINALSEPLSKLTHTVLGVSTK
ncbi:peptidase M75 family protein [Mycetocola tolaasinivorans]|uniref:Peptidase M75 family protein n=1 Tax=Mycetocola tolaasinivorans TaxID=76635 RepID=A0A3L7A7R6_9MICO|nr:iron uptake system protein EfeO [Mycetocola tolaasinivorans]RLP76416.1 peptidase M75 family protein [Mycetocola tolaasinivorans]